MEGDKQTISHWTSGRSVDDYLNKIIFRDNIRKDNMPKCHSEYTDNISIVVIKP